MIWLSPTTKYMQYSFGCKLKDKRRAQSASAELRLLTQQPIAERAQTEKDQLRPRLAIPASVGIHAHRCSIIVFQFLLLPCKYDRTKKIYPQISSSNSHRQPSSRYRGRLSANLAFWIWSSPGILSFCI